MAALRGSRRNVAITTFQEGACLRATTSRVGHLHWAARFRLRFRLRGCDTTQREPDGLIHAHRFNDNGS
jgi:hypothetical protein